MLNFTKPADYEVQPMISPIRLMMVMPLPPICWCVWSLAKAGTVDHEALFITLGLIAFGWGGAWLLSRFTEVTVRHREFVDIRPNQIAVSDGYEFDAAFSSAECLIANPEAFRSVLEQVADRAFTGTNKIFSIKESVYIRIWSGTFPVSSAEVDLVVLLAEELFIDPKVEVVGSAGDDRTAMQA